MIVEELVEPAPHDTRRLAEQRDRECRMRNQAGLHRWYTTVFGPEVGAVLFNEGEGK